MFYVYLGDELIYRPLDEDLVLFNPKCTLEIGKAGSVEFDIPKSNSYYNDINQLQSQVSVLFDDEEIFHGRVLSSERGFNNVRRIYCEGDLAYLIDSVQKTTAYTGTVHALFRKLIEGHNARVEAYKQFTVGTITVEDRPVVLTGQSDNLNVGDIDYKQIAIDSIVDDWNNTFDLIQTCIIDYCGGYLRTRRENGVNYIDLLVDFQSTATQEIELGTNLLDLKEEVTAEDLFTVLIPLGDDNLTIASVNDGSDELVDTDAVTQYGRIVRTHVFSNVSSAATLLENGRRYLENEVNVPRTITVTAVDLHLLNPAIKAIDLGDKVRLNSNPHDMDEYLTCTKIEYDMNNPANNKYTFGNPKQTLTARYKEDQRKSNDTYGNSESSGYSGGGYSGVGKVAAAAAEKVAEKVTKEQTEARKSFYDAYIDLKPDQGHITLASLYEGVAGDRDTIINYAGIDLDANDKSSIINLSVFHNDYLDNNEAVKTRFAGIDIRQDESEAAIRQNTEYIGEVEDDLGAYKVTSTTAINQVSNAVQAEVTARATFQANAENRMSTSESNITQLNTALQSEITARSSFQVSAEGRMTTSESNITQLNTALQSEITARSSFQTSAENRMTTSESNITQLNTNLQSEISARSKFQTSAEGRMTTAESNITQLNNDLKSEVSLTATYRTNNDKRVSSAEASITALADEYGSTIVLKADKVTVDADLTAIRGTITANKAEFDKLIAGTTTAKYLRAETMACTKSMNISGTLTHSDGYGYPLAYGDHSHNITENSDGTITIGYSSGREKHSFNIASTKKYKEGVAAVTLDSLVVNTASPWKISYSDGKLSVPIKWTLKNQGTSPKNGTLAISVDASEAVNSVGVEGIYVSGTPTRDGKTMKQDVYAKLTNGNTSSTKTISVNASTVFNAGRNDAADSITVSRGITAVDGYKKEDGAYYQKAKIKVVAYWTDNAGKTVEAASDESEALVWAGSVYNKGKDDGSPQGYSYSDLEDAYNNGRNSIDTGAIYQSGWDAGWNAAHGNIGYDD